MPLFLGAVPGTPNIPDSYAKAHPDRVREFRITERKVIDPETVANKPRDRLHDEWRHELKHDAESVFWLLLYWAMVVQPTMGSQANIDVESWNALNNNHESRERLINNLVRSMPSNLNHPFYNPLQSLIKDLATILVIDTHWLPIEDPRNDPCYITEAFQRLILQFIIENRDKGFMHHPVQPTFRTVQRTQASNGLSASRVQSLDATVRERVSSVGCECGSMNSYPFLLLCLQGADDEMNVDNS